MRKSLISACTFLLLLIAIAILGSGIYRQSRLDASSREFAIHVTQIILSGNPRYEAQEDLEDAPELEEPPTAAETLASFAHPLLLEQRSMDALGKYLYTITLNLGPLQVVQSINGGSDVPLFVFDSQIPSATHNLQVEFSAGSAQVMIDMILEGDEWLITAFSVETTLLSS